MISTLSLASGQAFSFQPYGVILQTEFAFFFFSFFSLFFTEKTNNTFLYIWFYTQFKNRELIKQDIKLFIMATMSHSKSHKLFEAVHEL